MPIDTEEKAWPPKDIRTGYSAEYPARYVRSRGKVQFRFNITETTGPEGERHYRFDYAYIDSDGIDKEAVEKVLTENKVSAISAAAIVTESLDKDGKVVNTEWSKEDADLGAD